MSTYRVRLVDSTSKHWPVQTRDDSEARAATYDYDPTVSIVYDLPGGWATSMNKEQGADQARTTGWFCNRDQVKRVAVAPDAPVYDPTPDWQPPRLADYL